MTTAARVRAAALWAGPDAYLSGAAGCLVVALDGHRTHHGPGHQPALVASPQPARVTVVRRPLPFPDRRPADGVPVTGQALTALYGPVEMGSAGPAMLDRALQRSVRFADVRRAH